MKAAHCLDLLDEKKRDLFGFDKKFRG